MREAEREMKDGEVFSFTFGTLAHYDAVMLVEGKPYEVFNGKPRFRLYV